MLIMSINKLILVTILVNDFDVALDFYCNKLGFTKRMDRKTETSRFITIQPKNQKEIEIILRKPHAMLNELLTLEMRKVIKTGPLWSFSTSDIDEAYNDMSAKGVKITQTPFQGELGRTMIFEDPFGNSFSLIEVK